ncbi:hypothetical protein BHE74_00046837 [Ensete ventricosum]|nr:hypothetical protein BHE74_00046837 [Ensete ventricosum]
MRINVHVMTKLCMAIFTGTQPRRGINVHVMTRLGFARARARATHVSTCKRGTELHERARRWIARPRSTLDSGRGLRIGAGRLRVGEGNVGKLKAGERKDAGSEQGEARARADSDRRRRGPSKKEIKAASGRHARERERRCHRKGKGGGVLRQKGKKRPRRGRRGDVAPQKRGGEREKGVGDFGDRVS